MARAIDIVQVKREIQAGKLAVEFKDSDVLLTDKQSGDAVCIATLTPPNEPLSTEQLREMNGEPVWVEFEDGSGGLWGIVHITIFAQIVFANGLHCTIGERYYGKSYKAYRRPPEGEEDT